MFNTSKVSWGKTRNITQAPFFTKLIILFKIKKKTNHKDLEMYNPNIHVSISMIHDIIFEIFWRFFVIFVDILNIRVFRFFSIYV